MESEASIKRISKTTFDLPAETLEFINSDLELKEAVRYARGQYSILNRKLLYKRTDDRYRWVPAIDVALLLGAGYRHDEIADHLMTGRINVTRMAIRLREAGVPLQRSSSRRGTSVSTELTAKRSHVEKKISELKEAFDNGEITHTTLVRLVVERLNKNDRTQQKKYEQYTIGVGVGPPADRKLDSFLQETTITKKGSGQQDTKSGSPFTRSIDRLLAQYFKGAFSYFNSYKYGIFSKPWYLERFEASIRFRHLRRCVKSTCSTCTSSRRWLTLPEFCRPKNNPIVSTVSSDKTSVSSPIF